LTPYDFALIAQEAYTSAPDIGVESSASRAIVRQTEAGLVIAFPGSDNIASWLHDFDIITVKVSGVGDVHQGFWRAWQAIEADVIAVIGDKPVTLVGHSLGGAMAICAAVSLTLADKPPAGVYGFEAPRVSPGAGVRAFLAKVPVFLTRNGLDVVPQVPPDWSQSADLEDIGHAAIPIDNAIDHDLQRVIAALAPVEVAA
jgi:triacylglycerol lipase